MPKASAFLEQVSVSILRLSSRHPSCDRVELKRLIAAWLETWPEFSPSSARAKAGHPLMIRFEGAAGALPVYVLVHCQVKRQECELSATVGGPGLFEWFGSGVIRRSSPELVDALGFAAAFEALYGVQRPMPLSPLAECHPQEHRELHMVASQGVHS